MTAVVIDTNVPVVANGQCPQASLACAKACIATLLRAVRQHIVVADRGLRIFAEYRNYLSLSGQPGVGDMFYKHVWQNQANPEYCKLVDIHPTDADENNFQEFPDAPELAGFDPSDRKFVAAALASGLNPPVLNAVDSDWWNFRAALAVNGVTVEFLCPNQFQGRD